ncbi:hypothetical protein, partial [Streptomyces sp. NPDC059538]|uniref:hypothetical protein n=1 Tax=Streptomyces sp. NPDC059538 TaxID=3346860 RepID=UPI00368B788D
MPHEPQPQAPDELDAEAVRTWSSLALAALGRAPRGKHPSKRDPGADPHTRPHPHPPPPTPPP